MTINELYWKLHHELENGCDPNAEISVNARVVTEGKYSDCLPIGFIAGGPDKYSLCIDRR